MLISELEERLSLLKKVYGDIKVVGSDDYAINFVEPMKFIKTSSDHNDIISLQTEGLDEDFLEKMYVENDEYEKFFVSKGTCVKLY